jgi:hypothetical protein
LQNGMDARSSSRNCKTRGVGFRAKVSTDSTEVLELARL